MDQKPNARGLCLSDTISLTEAGEFDIRALPKKPPKNLLTRTVSMFRANALGSRSKKKNSHGDNVDRPPTNELT